jgi:uncharacterized membrane protein YhiD involved in acid resistance
MSLYNSFSLTIGVTLEIAVKIGVLGSGVINLSGEQVAGLTKITRYVASRYLEYHG